MAALTEGTDYEVVGINRGDVTNEIVIRCINTVDDTDTLTVDLTAYGIRADGFIGAHGYEHTTDNSVSVQADPTTSVSSGTLTLTVSGSNDNNPRFYFVKGFSNITAATDEL